ncbi:MAG: lipoyl(octanoyl) transferase LipB [Alistipes sp.]|nr:lipoyl(octanoyl) transferase LipB [Alistipes sp.]
MKLNLRDLGTMSYGVCWELQRNRFDELLRYKAEDSDPDPDTAGDLLLVEHRPVYTLGKSGKRDNLLVTEQYLSSLGAEFFHIDRGGDITFHGPGQLVGYPILDLEKLGIGLRTYIDTLEEAAIRTVAHYGIEAGRVAGASGVWLDATGPRMRKICAIGVRSSRFVTMHGFGLNVSTDLSWFDRINPCGFKDRGVTSIEKETGHRISMDEVKCLMSNHLSELLNVKIYK